MKRVAIVIPVLNESANIAGNLDEILSHTQVINDIEFKLIVVDDGSTDNTAELIAQKSKSGSPIDLLCLTRNFGKESAIYAGLTHSLKFDAAIVMDSDLQHPLALIPQMITKWQESYAVVEASKSSRGEETRSKNFLVRIYYRMFNFFTKLSISGDTDYKLLDVKVVRAYLDLPEHNRFFRGLIKWMNFSTAQILFDVPDSVRKESTWSNPGLIRYAVSSITSFTAFPLQIVTLLGGVTFLVSVVIGVIALLDKLSGEAVDGFTTVILLILLIGSVLMFSVGLIGTYVGKIYDEVKHRPNYLVDHDRSNLEESE